MNFKLNGYYKLKMTPELIAAGGHKEYPTGTGLKTWDVYHDDLFTKNKDGALVKHTGLCVLGIQIPDEDLEFIDKEATLGFLDWNELRANPELAKDIPDMKRVPGIMNDMNQHMKGK